MKRKKRVEAKRGYSFKNHPITSAERLWIKEVIDTPKFDARTAKIRLWSQLPPHFEPRNMDERLMNNGQVTPIGLWLVDPENVIFKELDAVIKSIRSIIIKDPGVETIRRETVAEACGISSETAGRRLYQLNELGRFHSGAQPGAGGDNYNVISLSGDNGYDEYLRYENLDDILERYYVARTPKRASISGLYHNILNSSYINVFGNKGEGSGAEVESVKPNTAFVIMAMNPEMAELEDVYVAIKETCRDFGIKAHRVDEIQHQERITDLILQEIRTCEYLIADLTHERPNVYYEIGYAHAINKKPILFRKTETKVHFDLSVHNVPAFRNVTELRDLLRKRLEAILGRSPKGK